VTDATQAAAEFKIVFGVGHEGGAQGDRLHALEGLTPADLQALGDETGAHVTTRRGSVGKGAAGPGVELILAYASVPGDILALIEIGKMIKQVIRKVQSHRATRTVTISDRDTMAAVAAASATGETAAYLAGTRLLSVRNLSGGEPPNWLGTDSRDVWAVVFEHETQGHVLVIFMSPSGLVLGSARVPLEYFWDGSAYQRRTMEDIADYGNY
jgi:hypothetical protein